MSFSWEPKRDREIEDRKEGGENQLFNVVSLNQNRKKKIHQKEKRMHIYGCSEHYRNGERILKEAIDARCLHV